MLLKNIEPSSIFHFFKKSLEIVESLRKSLGKIGKCQNILKTIF